MSTKFLFPSAVDAVRLINNNIVDNLLVRRSSYVQLPSLYQFAYAIVYETGELPVQDDLIAPDESINKNNTVNIVTGSINR